MTKKTLLMTLVLYVFSATITFTVLSVKNGSTVSTGGEQQVGESPDGTTALGSLLEIDPSEPRDQVCPLNGELFTQTEKDAWSKRRPLAVMIENTPDARPQSGLSNSDVVFEAMAEGGVTRFMALYYCGAQASDIILAPIRSARSYFVDYASGFNDPMYVHVGGANLPGLSNALGQIRDYGWEVENDINQFSVGYPTFVRNANRIAGKQVATEHTMETSTERLWAVAEDREWTNMSPDRKVGKIVVPGSDWAEGYTGWTYETSKPAPQTAAAKVSYEFWTGYTEYGVSWEYDATADTYKRILAGAPHVDLNTSQQLTSDNVIVLLTQEKGPINELKHMLYATTGAGDALLFKHGEVNKIKWNKKDRESELKFVDARGKDIALTPGRVWISVVDTSTEVTY